MDFRGLNVAERTRLRNALRNNADSDGAVGLLMDQSTGFVGESDDVENSLVINAIHSVPSHY